MSSTSCTNDRQELERVTRKILWRLSRPPQSLRLVLQELDVANVMGPDLTMIFEYLVFTDSYYCQMVCSTSRHSSRKAHRRRRMIYKAFHLLYSSGKILTSDGHIVHPTVWPANAADGDLRRPKRRKKFDQRPYHGRPGRDRGRFPQHVAA
ncbi:MAG: hypothetical protein H6797_01685 [Candidatus Nomurabacteria bacterium]|nr:MAG: hypothetical protein H6797_01685 [Candidatus Nomurabacteria bacterium]